MRADRQKKNTSTPSFEYKGHPSRGESWNPKSVYLYWEIPKNKLLLSRARALRKAGNLSEVLFWETFKDKQKLVFEIDGSSHIYKAEYDTERDAFTLCKVYLYK